MAPSLTIGVYIECFLFAALFISFQKKGEKQGVIDLPDVFYFCTTNSDISIAMNQSYVISVLFYSYGRTFFLITFINGIHV